MYTIMNINSYIVTCYVLEPKQQKIIVLKLHVFIVTNSSFI